MTMLNFGPQPLIPSSPTTPKPAPLSPQQAPLPKPPPPVFTHLGAPPLNHPQRSQAPRTPPTTTRPPPPEHPWNPHDIDGRFWSMANHFGGRPPGILDAADSSSSIN